MKEFVEVAKVITRDQNIIGCFIKPTVGKKEATNVTYIDMPAFWQLVRDNRMRYLEYDVNSNNYVVRYTDEDLREFKKSRTASKYLTSIKTIDAYFADDPCFYADTIQANKFAFTPLMLKSVMNRMLLCVGMLYTPYEIPDDTIKIWNKDNKKRLGGGNAITIKRMYKNILHVTITLNYFIFNPIGGAEGFPNVFAFLNGNFDYCLGYLQNSNKELAKAFKMGTDVTGAGLQYVSMLGRYLEKCKVIGVDVGY